MPGDWVPIRTDLPSTREVLEIAGTTGLDRFHVAGLLVAFWSWFQSQTESGHLSLKCPDKILPQVVGGTQKFWQAVEKAGWIYQDAEGFGIPNADRWNGKTTKARLGEVLRKRIHRAEKRATKQPPPLADVPDLSGQTADKGPDQTPPQNTEDSIQKDTISPPKSKAGVPRFLELYHDLFLERFGTKPNINEGKDPGIAKRLLAKFGQAKLESYLRRYLASTDQFIVDAGFTLGVFEVKLNTFVVAGSGNGKGGAGVSDLTPEQRERAEAVYGGKNPTGV